MGSSKVVYWLSETWGVASTYNPDRALTYSTSHTEDQDYSGTDEGAAIRR
ncbi:hypothetical protein NP493_1404g00043 [Ridgeia piscesae]|uniref:Uncharacterized protein n=1 Tax=Ridgeia piscesae TaxID=27915 RepID=A0AAD9K4G5_RIDPI|nr:hypothetical protein NP493_1404g00043 [Ridgeia piscesae]